MLNIRPGNLEGLIVAPASKSDAQRALAAASLVRGRSSITGYTPCADSDAALGVIVALGADTEVRGETIVVNGWRRDPEAQVDCGESGLCLRMFAAIAALHSREITLDGRGSLRARPIGMIADALGACGVSCRSNQGRLPLTVRGPLRGGAITVDGSVTSQHVTGLLFALPLAADDTRLVVERPASRPYLAMTVRTLAAFGVGVEVGADPLAYSVPGRQSYRPTSYKVEGDWSGASCLLVAGAIAGSVAIDNLDPHSAQADRAILDVLRRAGARVTVDGHRVTVEAGTLSAFEWDAADAPDLVPALVALACSCGGTSRITGVARLRHKESDRVAALVDMFRGLGGAVASGGDRLEVTGGALRGGEVDTRHDHRMAMAATVAALRTASGVTLGDAECVKKSYPRFFEDLRLLGARS